MRRPERDILGPGGPVARALGPGFDARPQQLKMAEAVARTLASKGRLVVEAGTGVGKSFAYLVPAMLRCVAHHERVVISTHTINLQEQLLRKDVPLLTGTMGNDAAPWGLDGGACVPLAPVLVKGRGNYVSIRRLEMASKRQGSLLTDQAERRSLHVIEDWAYATDDGSLQTLPPLERPGIWDRVQSDTDNCMGRRCPRYQQCFYQKSRAAIELGNLLICNHAVFIADLKLKANGTGFLPEYQHVIFDEAHSLEEVASEHFGLSLTEGRVEHYLRVLCDHTSGRGYLPQLAASVVKRGGGGGAGDVSAQALIDRCVAISDEAQAHSRALFEQLLSLVRSGELRGGRLPAGRLVQTQLPVVLRHLGVQLRALKEALKGDSGEEDRFELNAYAVRADAIAFDAEVLTQQKQSASVYWVEGGLESGADAAPGRGRPRVKIACAPIDAGASLQEHLFSKKLGIVMTSATLATGTSAVDSAADGAPGSEGRGSTPERSAEPRFVADVDAEADVDGDSRTSAPERSAPERSPPERSPPERSPPERKARKQPADPFAHFTARLGVADAQTLQLGSPFDYATQVELIVDLTVPDPRRSAGGAAGRTPITRRPGRAQEPEDGLSAGWAGGYQPAGPVNDHERYIQRLADRILHHAASTNGGAFVLFTSNATMNACAALLEPALHAAGLPMLVQGRDGRPGHVLDRFRTDPASVLLGAASFWQGVDVRGDALRNVIITKLPFDPPDRPLIEARCERIKARGGDPFREESLPRAVLRFRQGFGRLIRSSTDRGQVVVLDRRIVATGYGRAFIAALPPGVPVRTISMPTAQPTPGEPTPDEYWG